MDLCRVLDVLGDYPERRNHVADAPRRIRNATGFPANVKATDRAEWRNRSAEYKSSIERHIARHAVQLASRPPAGPIDCAKESRKAASYALEGDHLGETDDVGGLSGDAATAGVSGEQASVWREIGT